MYVQEGDSNTSSSLSDKVFLYLFPLLTGNVNRSLTGQRGCVVSDGVRDTNSIKSPVSLVVLDKQELQHSNKVSLRGISSDKQLLWVCVCWSLIITSWRDWEGHLGTIMVAPAGRMIHSSHLTCLSLYKHIFYNNKKICFAGNRMPTGLHLFLTSGGNFINVYTEDKLKYK